MAAEERANEPSLSSFFSKKIHFLVYQEDDGRGREICFNIENFSIIIIKPFVSVE